MTLYNMCITVESEICVGLRDRACLIYAHHHMPLHSLMSVLTIEREPDTQRSQPKMMPRLHILPDGVYTERDTLPNTPYNTPKTVAASIEAPVTA